MKTATRTVSGANTAEAPPVRPEDRTAGKNENSRIVHVTDEFRGRRALPPRPCNFRKSGARKRARKAWAPAPPAAPPEVPPRSRRFLLVAPPATIQESGSHTPRTSLPTLQTARTSLFPRRTAA